MSWVWYYGVDGEIILTEPCDCGERIRHNNGGNYHEEIRCRRAGSGVHVIYGSTREAFPGDTWDACEHGLTLRGDESCALVTLDEFREQFGELTGKPCPW